MDHEGSEQQVPKSEPSEASETSTASASATNSLNDADAGHGATEQAATKGFSSFGQPYEPYRPDDSTEDRWYLNRAFIAAACIFVGVLIGKLVQDRPVQPALAAAIQYQADRDAVSEEGQPGAKSSDPQEPLVKIPFRKLASADDFDPLDPLKGGFPIPPKKVEEKLVSGGQVRVIPPADLARLPGPMLEPLEGELPPFDPTSGTTTSAPSGSGIGLPDPNGPRTGIEVSQPVAVELELPYAVGGASAPSADGLVSRLAAIASANGGKARSFDHMGLGGSIEGKGVLIVVPIENYMKAERAARRVAGVSLDQAGRLSEGARQVRLSAIFKTRLEELQEKRKELLVDFLEDSPVVKDIDVAIVAEAKAVSASRLGGDSNRQGAILVIVREG